MSPVSACSITSESLLPMLSRSAGEGYEVYPFLVQQAQKGSGFTSAIIVGGLKQTNTATVYYTYTYTDTLTALTVVTKTGPSKVVCTVIQNTCPEGITYNYVDSETRQFTRVYNLISSDSTTATFLVANAITNTNLSLNYSLFNNPYYIDPAQKYSLSTATALMADNELLYDADPDLLAAIANKLWQSAAQQPGYAGAPYDAANPITAADILAGVAAGLFSLPTVSDLISPVQLNPQTDPKLDPNAQPVAATDPAATTVNVDFGPDPGIAPHVLETEPTGSAIVSQVMGLLPSLSGFTMPAHTSTCFAPSFTLFGSVQNMQPMCDLLEQQRLLLSTIFSAMWGVTALAMVLRA